MFFVFATRDVFKIVDGVVRWITVFVVDFVSVWTRPEKGGCHEPVDVSVILNATAP